MALGQGRAGQGRAGQGVVTDHSCRCGNVDLGPYQIGDVDHKAFSKPLNKINETD